MAARWRLTAPHYLNTGATEWEYKETDRSTGKQVRRVFQVPTYLHPDDPGDWNYRQDKDNGEIIVANAENENSRDIIFTGDPTPDMVPLNDEAKAISASFAKKWIHPIESLDRTYGDKLVEGFQSALAELQTGQAKAAPVEGMSELLAAMTAMMKQNQELISAIGQRRV